ncbi:hypothetical protein [Streptomyces sp. NBC_01538]
MIANGRHEPLNRPDHKIVDRTNLLDGDRDAGGKADGEYEWLR